MSKDQAFPNILFVYESNPEYTDFYLIPADAEMSVNLRKAVLGIDGLMVNVTDIPDGDKLWKQWAYVCAAITKEASHLDEDDAHEQNRFHGHLLPFKLTAAEVGDNGWPLNIEGPLTLVRAGIFM